MVPYTLYGKVNCANLNTFRLRCQDPDGPTRLEMRQITPGTAREAQIILTDLACFTQEEIDEICEAIAQHGAKDELGDEMSELI